MADAELVRDREQGVLVLTQHLGFEKLAPLFKHTGEGDDSGALLVPIRATGPKQRDGVTNLVADLVVLAGEHRIDEFAAGFVGHSNEPASVVAAIGQAQADVTSVEQLIDPPTVDFATRFNREVA